MKLTCFEVKLEGDDIMVATPGGAEWRRVGSIE
jgi:hypothetical protein